MTLSTDPFPTYRLIGDALKNKGYETSQAYEDGHLAATYISPNGAQWKTYAARIRYPFTSDEAHQLSTDKEAAYRFAETVNVSIPYTQKVGLADKLDLVKLAEVVESHGPLIVKPNNASLSKGLTLNIDSVEELTEAIESARTIKQSDVLIQQQVTGDEIRFVVVRGKVKAALLRQTPRVVGDGESTIRELVEQENTLRKDLVFPYISYPQLTGSIAPKEVLESLYIPTNGEVVEFSRATMIRNGCSVYNILDEVHPSYIEAIEAFIATVDTKFLVVDFLVKNYTTPSEPHNYWFLEFNVSPVLKLCYGCRDGKMFDIIPIIADLIDETIN